MVRALPGQLPRGSSMMTCHFRTRKYRPSIENLERKELCSVGASTVATTPHWSPCAPVSTPVEVALPRPCGTGKGSIIITR
jgi:hypothetical protein